MTRELYINGHLCDLGESKPTLIFQSPIFNDLDVIQSNRSAEINLPLTQGNRAAFDLIDRIDVEDDSAAYKRFPASYYMGGFPIFTNGYAFITDITDTINITLVWGNINNFQPLFDASLRDLREQFIEIIGQDYVNWDENANYIKRGLPTSAGFFAVDFGVSLMEYDLDTGTVPDDARQFWKYTHPSVLVSTILLAIEKYSGITIEGKDILSRVDGNDLLIPLVSKNSGPDSWHSDRFEASSSYFTNSDNGYYPLFYNKDNITADKRQLIIEEVQDEGTPAEIKFYKEFYVGGINSVSVSILSHDTNPISFNGHRKDSSTPALLRLDARREDGREDTLLSVEDISTTGNVITFALNDIFNDTEVDVADFNAIWWSLENFETNGGNETYVSARFIITPHMQEILFPSPFPIAENLPDMSHADFLLSLLTMHGVFAYADNSNPNTIRLLYPDDLFNAIGTQYDYRSVDTADLRTPDTQSDRRIVDRRLMGIADWSRKIILNDQGEVWRPESTEFTMDDYAQKNTVDYDNDEDAEELNTAGIITIENESLENEYELATLEFSASKERFYNNINSIHDKTTFAVIPCYEVIYENAQAREVRYKKPSPRILSLSITTINGLATFEYGRFPRTMYFGGTEGLLASNYTGFQRILQKFRMITVYAKLTIADIYNLDFSRRIYLDVYGCYFAIYSVTTGENGICECKLIKL